jgi:predicted phosphodiesterase
LIKHKIKKPLYTENVLVIADTHIPFEHKNYLDFCLDVQKRCKCGTVVHIGDLVDNHAISYHEHDPNGKSPHDEMKEADKHLERWFKSFPKLRMCLGNHDRLVDRKAKTAGLPERAFLAFRDIWRLPKEWETDFEYKLYGVKYVHGTGYSGKQAHVQAAYDNRCSTVMGHLHSVGAVQYIDTSEKENIFGMNVGCGIDKRSYAFAYGKYFKFKPILGCGVVTDGGKYAQFFPMD